jgi:prepilin-type N-terminal cleavage/methylation domain-containing protein
MILNNNTNKERGFTIVELLIVIVVIGILAAITIVAYNGVQNRARTTTAAANAQEVQSKAEVYAADTGNGAYPTAVGTMTGLASTDTAALTPSTKALLGTVAPTSTTTTVLQFISCGTTGIKVAYWDSTAAAIRYVAAGAANPSATVATC